MIRSLTSKDFGEKNVNPDSATDPFLGITPDRLETHFHWRFMSLANALFNLRHSEGFAILQARLEESSLRSVFFEAQAASVMTQAGFQVSFHEETGSRGQDFDFVAKKGVDQFNCEVTAFSTPDFKPETVRNTLNRKRQQLPMDAPALIFCTLAEGWVGEKVAPVEQLEQLAADFLARTGRINAVIFLWDAFAVFPSRGWTYALMQRSVSAANPRHAADIRFLPNESADAEKVRSFVLGFGPPPPTNMDYLSFARSIEIDDAEEDERSGQ
ncbi:hypothetical protein [Brevundimonas sp. R86498]|uniref:hypothetical protein n=1 Tax=Brevundimonas sp. R86498 TaxID=3093845 RepID=UPI0037CC5A28